MHLIELGNHPQRVLAKSQAERFRTSGWTLWAAAAALIILAPTVAYPVVDVGVVLVFLGILATVPALLYWVHTRSAKVRRARSGRNAEAQTRRALQRLPDSYTVLAHAKPASWLSDIDFLVVAPDRIVLVESKSHPAADVDVERWVRTTNSRAVKLKLLLIAHAKAGAIAPGIQTPHAFLAVWTRQGPAFTDACNRLAVPDLAAAIQALPPNASQDQARQVLQVVQAGAA